MNRHKKMPLRNYVSQGAKPNLLFIVSITQKGGKSNG